MNKGFKQWCENEAVNWRHQLSLYAYDPLEATQLAAVLNVSLLPPTEIPDFDASLLMRLSGRNDSGWSAATLVLPGYRPLIIYNPYHYPSRHEANIMHELAHLILKHKPITLSTGFPILRLEYHQEDEEEAKYLGGCLQITQAGLDWAIGRGLSREEMAHHFGASPKMVQYRLNMTGRHQVIAK